MLNEAILLFSAVRHNDDDADDDDMHKYTNTRHHIIYLIACHYFSPYIHTQATQAAQRIALSVRLSHTTPDVVVVVVVRIPFVLRSFRIPGVGDGGFYGATRLVFVCSHARERNIQSYVYDMAHS